MVRRPPARCSARLVNGEQRAGGVRKEQERAAERGRARERERAARRAREAARAAEVEDSPRLVKEKCRQLARAIRNAKHLVVYTGAGISTAADIPDYRGPEGVWTRLRRGEAPGTVDVARAEPTFTHMALRALHDSGRLRFVVSQNCDGLHLRSGLPRRALAELHGDMFLERCPRCPRVYVRGFDTTERTARHTHGTRRTCYRCGTPLLDTIVHFGERGRAAWPLNWAGALRHAARADVVLCLGSSLKVLRRYPRLWRMSRPPHLRPRLYIVNLQWTPKDAVAELKINARCDDVMEQVARRLRLPVPRYSPGGDPLLAHVTPLSPGEAHTTRRVPLSPPPASPPAAPPPRASPLSSPSASDSEDDRPLLRVAASMQLARRHPHLRLFQVKLCDGEAGILLHAAHAPSASAPPAPAPARRSPLLPLNGLRHHGTDGVKDSSDVDDVKEEVKVKSEVEEIKVKSEVEEFKVKSEVEEVEMAAARAAAGRYFARAVAACRHALYPGLHTILRRAECEWCEGRGAPRCLWYPRGAPRLSGDHCTCCGGEGGEGDSGGGADSGGGGGEEPRPGWFGKGYRKGRRHKR